MSKVMSENSILMASSVVDAVHSTIQTRLGLFGKSHGLEEKLVDLLCILMFLLGAFLSIFLLFINASYGRYESSSSTLFAFKINAKLAWFCQEIPSFGIPVAFMFFDHKHGTSSFTKLVLGGLFALHYWQRSCVYPFLTKGGKPMPLFICFLAFTFCTVNGYIQIRSIQFAKFPDDWLSRKILFLGVLLFFIGLAINIHSDHILRNLRKPGETRYKIPKGGMFEYVSAANYFGESLEWFGFFLAVQTTAAAAFSFFTVCNLWPRAISHHRWYKKKFDDYPRIRKAILPLIL